MSMILLKFSSSGEKAQMSETNEFILLHGIDS